MVIAGPLFGIFLTDYARKFPYANIKKQVIIIIKKKGLLSYGLYSMNNLVFNSKPLVPDRYDR